MNRFAATILVSLAGIACGQKSDQDTNSLLLAGPTVAETNVTGLTSAFIASEGGDRSRMAMRADGGLFRQILAEIREADDPALRLSPEQQAELAGVVREFQARADEFERVHGRELRGLTAPNRPSDRRAPESDRRPAPSDKAGNSDPGPADAMAITGSAEVAAARRGELEALRPNPGDLERPIRALLNGEQVAYLDRRIEEISRERFEARAMDRLRREAADQLSRQKSVTINTDRLPERLRKRIEALPPEQRAAALERVREMYAQSRRPGERDRASRPDGGKPAPGMDQVEIPKPRDDG